MLVKVVVPGRHVAGVGFIETEIKEDNFHTFKKYELLNNFYGEITIENFRLLTERTTWNYDIIEDIEEV